MNLLNHASVRNKKVFLRVDFNVPLKNNNILDNTKIRTSLPTIRYLLQNNATIILATHLGRPEGKIIPSLSTRTIVKEIQHLLPKQKITFLKDCIGKEIKQKINDASSQEIFLLENLRFYKEEENNDPLFAHSLASLAEIYVNDAFSVSHRSHASVESITPFLPSYAGFSLQKEIYELHKALYPKRPAVWIIGGAKLDKVSLIEKALEKADYVLIGGALPFPFLRAKNIPIGLSKIDTASMTFARTLLKHKYQKKIILPLDFVVADKIAPYVKTEIVSYNAIKNDQLALDLGPDTIELFKHYLRKAQTIVWNGPLGYFEYAKFSTATKEIGRFIGTLTATTICGGGETSAAIYKFHLEHNLTHVSLGGEASLEFLSGKILPGILALEQNRISEKRSQRNNH